MGFYRKDVCNVWSKLLKIELGAAFFNTAIINFPAGEGWCPLALRRGSVRPCREVGRCADAQPLWGELGMGAALLPCSARECRPRPADAAPRGDEAVLPGAITEHRRSPIAKSFPAVLKQRKDPPCCVVRKLPEAPVQSRMHRRPLLVRPGLTRIAATLGSASPAQRISAGASLPRLPAGLPARPPPNRRSPACRFSTGSVHACRPTTHAIRGERHS